MLERCRLYVSKPKLQLRDASTADAPDYIQEL